LTNLFRLRILPAIEAGENLGLGVLSIHQRWLDDQSITIPVKQNKVFSYQYAQVQYINLHGVRGGSRRAGHSPAQFWLL
jgi:hypothetical protein